MLEQANSLLFHQLVDHVAQDGTDSIEALVCLANVREANIVEEYLLYDENGDGLAELGASLHDAQTKRDDLGCQEEVDDLGRIILDESADNTKRSKAKVFEWSRLGRRVKERVEEKRNVRWGRSASSCAISRV